MLVGPALALPVTCLLFAAAALFSPRPRPRREALGRVSIPAPGAPAMFALVPLGVGLGIPLALGLMPGSILMLIGALAACTAGHGLLASATRADGTAGDRRASLPSLGDELVHSPSTWFAVVGLCLLAATLRFSTLSLGDALAAQAVAGPGPLVGPPLLSAVAILGGIVGIVAGAAWVEQLPRVAGSPAAEALDAGMRWGESALAGTAVGATVWGPPVGALLNGPLGPLAGAVAMSTLVTLLAVGAVAALRTTIAQVPRAALLGTLCPVALIALLAARLA